MAQTGSKNFEQSNSIARYIKSTIFILFFHFDKSFVKYIQSTFPASDGMVYFR